MNPIKGYASVDVSYRFRLRGAGNQQNNTGLLFTGATHVSGGVTVRQGGLALGGFSMQNRSGSTGVMGIGVRIPNIYWVAGQWVDAAGTPFTDDTTDAQDTGTDDFVLETTTNNDGYVVGCRVPFNVISLDISTASAGAGDPARAVRYTNAAGSDWNSISNPLILTGAAADLSQTGTTDANEALVAIVPPVDWGKTQSGGLSGIPEGYYALNIRATTAPATTAAKADSLSIYRIYFLGEGFTDNSFLSGEWGAKEVILEPYGDALVALFETANDGNLVRALVRNSG